MESAESIHQQLSRKFHRRVQEGLGPNTLSNEPITATVASQEPLTLNPKPINPKPYTLNP